MNSYVLFFKYYSTFITMLLVTYSSMCYVQTFQNAFCPCAILSSNKSSKHTEIAGIQLKTEKFPSRNHFPPSSIHQPPTHCLTISVKAKHN